MTHIKSTHTYTHHLAHMIIFRDLKVENMLLDSNMDIKLIGKSSKLKVYVFNHEFLFISNIFLLRLWPQQ